MRTSANIHSASWRKASRLWRWTTLLDDQPSDSLLAPRFAGPLCASRTLSSSVRRQSPPPSIAHQLTQPTAAFIERAQFAFNPRMYTPEGFADVLHTDGFKGSWVDWLLKETEMSHGTRDQAREADRTMLNIIRTYTTPNLPLAKIRRFDSPDEHPFTPRDQLPQPILPPLNYPPLLYGPSADSVNVNAQIMRFYTQLVVPALTKKVTAKLGKENDDGNYGSAGTRDLECLQAMSRRIHCGMFVSESKFRSCPADFVPHILSKNTDALEALITKPAVEAALLVRLEKKARWYGIGAQDEVVDESKVEVDEVRYLFRALLHKVADDSHAQVVRVYRENIIPLTKDVEVDYLLRRLDGMSKEEVERLANGGQI
ncbi:chorismate mutase, partial [Phenoliferia sp. Uapishka_3]